jgi:glyoxalase family protein
MLQLLGHHHTSMFTKNANENKQFYSDILGLRLVKKTVNQDSPDMYHLFYGDEIGTPGTELTFFEITNAGHTRKGTNSIHLISLLVPNKSSLLYWEQRLTAHGITHNGISQYENYDALFFQDPDQLSLVLLSKEELEIPQRWQYWKDSPVPIEHSILGMGPIGIKVEQMEATVKLLVEIFHYTVTEQSEQRTILQAVVGEHWGEIIVSEDKGPRVRAGRGSVHHLALTVPNKEQLTQWNERLLQQGYKTTGIIDRYYFTSLYFHDNNGILFELATDGPGFTVDAALSELGEKLDLPPFLEVNRAAIEKRLQPLE